MDLSEEMADPSDLQVNHILGADAQKIISCNQKLQELDINDTIQLPRIVVIGDQSTGKSSLIESMSTISVPKAAGRCTRCPIAINITNSLDGTWRCTISTEERYAYDASRGFDITDATPLGPWMALSEMRITFIGTTEHREDLGGFIEYAQNGLLPSTEKPKKQTRNSQSINDVEDFTPNVIRLDVAIAGWPNLSFVDLPGVIMYDKTKHYVEIVEVLARQYARDENNVILLTLPLNHDNANSKSYAIVASEQVKSRTVAVFTKVDLAHPDQINKCLEQYFHEEAEEEFDAGHHIVMLGDGVDETEFFGRMPWNGLPLIAKQRLGVQSLKNQLRKILFEKTQKTLPENLRCIKTALATIFAELETIPQPVASTERITQAVAAKTKLERKINDLFAPSSPSRKALNGLIQTLADRIDDCKPVFKPLTEEEEVEKAEAQARLEEDDEIMEVDHDESATTKKAKSKLKFVGQRFSLDDIESIKTDYSTNVVGDIDPRAIEVMNKRSLTIWDKILERFLATVAVLVQKHTSALIESTFEDQRNLGIFSKIKELAQVHITAEFASQKTSRFDPRCAAEKETPFTRNRDLLSTYNNRLVQEKFAARKEARINLENLKKQAAAAAAGTKKQVGKFTEKDLTPDAWDVELNMSARSAAYYELASHRFIDVVCQDTLNHLLPACQTNVVTSIFSELGFDSISTNEAAITELLVENPALEQRRKFLVRKQTSLQEGYKHIFDVLGGDGQAGEEFAVSPLGNSSPNKRKANGVVASDVNGSPSKKSKKTDAAAITNGHGRRLLPNRGRSESIDINGDD